MSSFEDDLANAKKLLDALGTEHPDYLDAQTLYDRMNENTKQAQLHGDPSDLKSERSQIRREINRLSLKTFKITVENLGKKSDAPTTGNKPVQPPKPKLPQPSVLPDQPNGKIVFISHTTQDDDFVVRLADDMTRAGLKVWHDGKDIKVSHSIPAAINQALAGCGYFIIVLSPESVASHWVLQELDAALAGKKVILPVLLKDCERPALIQANKYADFRTDYQSGLNALFDGLDIHNETPNLPGLVFIFKSIERACYNSDLSPVQGQYLKDRFTGIAIERQKGEIPMSPTNFDNSTEMFSYTSQLLMFDLLSLAEYHAEWPHLVVSDSFKKDSIKLLKKMKQQVLVSSALVEQLNDLDCTEEIEQILDPLTSLQMILVNIDDCLLAGKMPFNIKNEIEKNFDDLTYHLNKYLLFLNELGTSAADQRYIQ